MTRLAPVICFLIVSATSQAATYRGRVQYASTGKPVPNVLVEARVKSGLNLLFLVPQMPYGVVATTSSRRDGTFEFTLSQHGRRLRFAALGRRETRNNVSFSTDREIASPSPQALNIITVPNSFRPWHPKRPKI